LTVGEVEMFQFSIRTFTLRIRISFDQLAISSRPKRDKLRIIVVPSSINGSIKDDDNGSYVIHRCLIQNLVGILEVERCSHNPLLVSKLEETLGLEMS